MSDQNSNQMGDMGNCLPVSRDPGHSGQNEGLELRQMISEAMDTPLVQYPIDDTMPVKGWVYEKKPQSKEDFKPLQYEDKRKALEVLNRHLPSWDQIDIPKPPATVPESAPDSRLRLFPEAHLPLPPRCWSRRERLEAGSPYGSPKTTTPAKRSVKKPARRVKSKNWTETDGSGMEDAGMEDLEDDLPVLVVPDLIVTRPDGKMRQLQDPNMYDSGK